MKILLFIYTVLISPVPFYSSVKVVSICILYV